MKRVIIFSIIAASIAWGLGRLYFEVTGGFTISNISSDFAFDPRFETRALSDKEELELEACFNNSWRYLGKGCQSYVFQSDDGKYVLKFFKYQRFRNALPLEWFSFIPQAESYRLDKIAKKREKLDALFSSTALAFNELAEKTGLVFVHLNKTKNLNRSIKIYDKMGFSHELNLDDVEFIVQRRSLMLCDALCQLRDLKRDDDAKRVISELVAMVVDEYKEGFADNDHALMQNTGVLDGRPIHIDTGQFVRCDEMKCEKRAYQELFNKTYKFRVWLSRNYPAMNEHLEKELRAVMGNEFDALVFIPKK